jgi:hypothetical protein
MSGHEFQSGLDTSTYWLTGRPSVVTWLLLRQWISLPRTQFYSNEAWFTLNRYIKSQNSVCCSINSSGAIYEVPLLDLSCGVQWVEAHPILSWVELILLPLFCFWVMKKRSLLWSSGQSSWLQIRVGFPALPDFLRNSGSETRSTQPCEYNWWATRKKK